KKRQSTEIANEVSDENGLQCQPPNDTQQTISTAASSSSSEFEEELATNKPASDLTEPDLIDLNETYSVIGIATELRELQSLVLTCEHLIKQSQEPDFSEEIFTLDTIFFCKSLKDIATKLEHLCENRT
ncbi:unnamed protein product, partial [Rotaria sp. Silwood2]